MFIFLCVVAWLVFRTWLSKLLAKLLTLIGLGAGSRFQMVVDTEELDNTKKQAPNFWRALKKTDVQWIECEQKMAEKLGIQDMSSKSWARF